MPAEAKGATAVPWRIILAVEWLTNAAVAVEEVQMEGREVKVIGFSEVCEKLARADTWIRDKVNRAGERKVTDVLEGGGGKRMESTTYL